MDAIILWPKFAETLSEAKGYTDEQIAGLGSVLRFKGVVATYSELPTTGNQKGDVWQVTEKSAEYVWLQEGTAAGYWELFGDIRSTNKSFPSEWTTTGTRLAFCQQVVADATTLVGDVFVGGVAFSDLPASLGNAEAEVIVFNSSLGGKAVHIDLYSATTAPYYWSCNYYNNTVTPWVEQIRDVTVNGVSVLQNGVAAIDISGKQDTLTAGANITITNNVISTNDPYTVTIM